MVCTYTKTLKNKHKYFKFLKTTENCTGYIGLQLYRHIIGLSTRSSQVSGIDI